VALNDFDNSVEAQAQAKALIADPGVLGVVGHLSAETTQAALPLYQQAELAMSIPWPTAPFNGVSGVVSVAANTVETASRLNTLSRERGYKQVVTVSNQLDAIPVEAQAIALDTEAVTAGDLVVTLRQMDETLPLLGHIDVGSPQLVEVAAGAASGLVFISPGPAPADVDGTEAFVDAYQKLAGFAPGPRAVLAYDATNILLDAIERAMGDRSIPPTRDNVGAVMTGITRQGLSGEIAFDAQGQRVNAPVWVYRISKEEKYPGVLVTPEE
jgi:ABC-type branched-subunit amino acid transport system substrate-binding protein